MVEFAEFLVGAGLGAFTDALLDSGFDDMEVIQQLSAEEMDALFEVSNMKVGHRMKFKQALARANSEAIEPPPPPPAVAHPLRMKAQQTAAASPPFSADLPLSTPRAGSPHAGSPRGNLLRENVAPLPRPESPVNYKARLIEIYSQANPGKIAEIDTIMQVYAARGPGGMDQVQRGEYSGRNPLRRLGRPARPPVRAPPAPSAALTSHCPPTVRVVPQHPQCPQRFQNRAHRC